MDESIKVIEREGRLVKISKTVSAEEALGASIDVYKFSAEGGKVFLLNAQNTLKKKRK